MPNPAFLDSDSVLISGSKRVEIGDYGTVTELTISGTIPEVLCPENTEIRYGILAVENADVYCLIDNNTNVFVTPSHYNFKFKDGDVWTDFRLGKQRYTVCTDDGKNAVFRATIANQEIVII